MLLLALIAQIASPGGDWSILHSWQGAEENSDFGLELDWIGDVDGDGWADIITCAPFHSNGIPGSSGGAAFLHSGSTGVELDRIINPYQPPWSFAIRVSRFGDITGDGKAEVAISKPSGQPGFLPMIQSYSVLPWTLLYEVAAPSQPSSLGTDRFAGGTDLNGDGCPDLVAADHSFQENGVFATGAVHAFSGVDGALLWRISGPGSSQFGGTVICPGDVNGDGYADVITRSQIYPGHVHALSGLDGSELYRFPGDYLFGFIGGGYRLAACGDADGDGLPDFFVSQGEDPGVSNGMATIHRGYDGAIIHRWEGLLPGENFGHAVGGPGDVDGDGRPDYLVGAEAGIGRARVYVFSGRDFRLMKTLYSPSTTPSTFGWTLGSLGADVTGDGGAEVLTSDDTEPVNGLHNAGAVYMFSFDRFLRADARELSAAAGGAVHFTLDFPATEAGLGYHLLVSEDLPGSKTIGGVRIPLVNTPLLQKMLFAPPPILDQPSGALDAQGDAVVTATLPAGALAGWVGRTVKLAAISMLAPSQPSLSSAPAWVEIVP
jgi:hypothetical protein